ncbi:MAG: hypothetical protein A2051_10340 [Desulfovibrionales bacterium GWA2_65_9]|nr:MAG: hypothetical protein A2051_10340 [Desulfovibrionales bacterium GWA2_65_9]
MIVVRLQGGLGNQMFQYAVGRALALARGVELVFDLSALAEDPLRSYALGDFQLAARLARPGELARLRSPLAYRLMRLSSGNPAGRALLRALGLPVLYEERASTHAPEVAYLPGHSLLVGFFQSERYFESIAGQLRQDFSLPRPLTPASALLAERINACESVSIHVRRTDYVDNPETCAMHGVLTPAHYTHCVELLSGRIATPEFFVFSDDPDWAEEHIRPGFPTTWVRPRPGASDTEDLVLMSRCRHNILANSSFSWWAAWLNPNPEAQVLAPKRWYQDPARSAEDLLPQRWEQVPCGS